MPDNDPDNLLPYGPIESIVDGVWRVVGELADRGPIQRSMVVLRRADGSLVIHSAIRMEEPAMRELDALGRPSAIVVPNAWHRIDAAFYKERYPQAGVYCPAKATKAVTKVVEVTGDYDAFPGGDDVRCTYLPGATKVEGVIEARGADGLTLLFNDLLLNLDRIPGLFGLVYAMFGGHGKPRIHRVMGLLMLRRRKELRAALERYASDPELAAVLVSHGTVPSDPAAFLRAM